MKFEVLFIQNSKIGFCSSQEWFTIPFKNDYYLKDLCKRWLIPWTSTQHWIMFLRSLPMIPECWFMWWLRHQMETFSALLALCAGNSPVTDEFPLQRPVTRSFDIFFDWWLNKRLRKQSRSRWLETSSRSLWRHCNVCGWWWHWMLLDKTLQWHHDERDGVSNQRLDCLLGRLFRRRWKKISKLPVTALC